MKRKLQRALSGLFLLSLVLLAGCSSGSGLVGVPEPGQAPPGPPLLPATDAGLAEHVPAQIIIGFVPKTDARKIATAVNPTTSIGRFASPMIRSSPRSNGGHRRSMLQAPGMCRPAAPIRLWP